MPYLINRYKEFEDILNELYDELPEGILDHLNGGILIDDNICYHPLAVNNELICLGVYRRNILGNSIVMYYGSFMELFGDLPHDEFKEKIRHTLYHELTHHIESLAGERDLEKKDIEFLKSYKNNKGVDKWKKF